MIAFRDATAADLPAIVALLADDALGSAREDAGPPLPPAYAEAFRRLTAQGGRVILACDGPVVAGCLQLNILHGLSQHGAARAQIESVRVAGSRRGQGIGGALMRHAIADACRAGCAMVQLTSNRTRTDAIRFYERLGFTHSHAGLKLAL